MCVFSCLFMYSKLQELIISHGSPETNAQTKARFILLDFKLGSPVILQLHSPTPLLRPCKHTYALNPQVANIVFVERLSEAAAACSMHSRRHQGEKRREIIHKNTPVKHTWSLLWSPPPPPPSQSHTHTHSCMDAHVERDFNQRSLEGCLYILSVGTVDFDQGQTIRINVCVYVLHVSKQMIKNDLLNGQKGTFKRRKSP